ncbi:hypothetical protein [Streptomyces sp. NPDC091371]|uniref:hypothetical protein n=1 Tax=Streptomyces sp. NPDC091371 TaxID=3155303 RepID=UPI0034490D0F
MSAARRSRTLLTTTAAAVLLTIGGAGLAAPASATDAARPVAARESRAANFYAGGVWYLYQTNATVRVDLTQDASGRLSGTTVDLTDPSSQATWFTERTF